MLNLFKNDRLAKAYQAILSDDPDKLLKQLQKIKTEEINSPTSKDTAGLVETCIRQQKPKLLKLVLEHGASPSGVTLDNISYGLFACQQKESLALLRELLQAGCDENKDQLLNQCFEHSPSAQRMLHIALLMEYGAEIDDPLLVKALKLGERPLILFLLNSGASLPKETANEGICQEVYDYAKKCVSDIEIRKMFL